MLNNLLKLKQALNAFHLNEPLLNKLIKFASQPIKVGDLVQIESGPDRGRRGTVQEIHPDENWAVVIPAPGYAYKKDPMHANYDELRKVSDIETEDFLTEWMEKVKSKDFSHSISKDDKIRRILKLAPYLYDLDDRKQSFILQQIKYVLLDHSGYFDLNEFNKLAPLFKEYPELLNPNILDLELFIYNCVSYPYIAKDNDFITSGRLIEAFKQLDSKQKGNLFFRLFDGWEKKDFIKVYQTFADFLDYLLGVCFEEFPSLYFRDHLSDYYSSKYSPKEHRVIPGDTDPEAFAYQVFTKEPEIFLELGLEKQFTDFREYETNNNLENSESFQSTLSRILNKLLYQSKNLGSTVARLLINDYLDDPNLRRQFIYKMVVGINPDDVDNPDMNMVVFHLLNKLRKFDKGRDFLEELSLELLHQKKYIAFYNSDLMNMFKVISEQYAREFYKNDRDNYLWVSTLTKGKFRKFMFDVGDLVKYNEPRIRGQVKGHIVQYDPINGNMQVKINDEFLEDYGDIENGEIITTDAWHVEKYIKNSPTFDWV